MSTKPTATQHGYTDPEVLGAYAALKRAAEIARQVAFLTGTDVITLRDGRVVRESGSESHDLRADGRPSNVRPLVRPLR